MEHVNTAQHQFLKSLENMRHNGELNKHFNETGLMHVQSIHQEKFTLDCPSRTIASLHTFSCGLYISEISD